MCRAEAHQLYAKKPLFDALGVQLFAVLHEYKESEVFNILQACNFWLFIINLWLMYNFDAAGKRILASILGWCCNI